LWRTDDTEATAVANLNMSLRRVSDCAAKWRLAFSIKKCVYTYFRHFALKKPPPPPLLNNKPLSFREHPRYLGLWFDHKLRWGAHITNVAFSVMHST